MSSYPIDNPDPSIYDVPTHGDLDKHQEEERAFRRAAAAKREVLTSMPENPDVLKSAPDTYRTDIASELCERLKLRYMGNCKCGRCALVPDELVSRAAEKIERLTEALQEIENWSRAYPLKAFPEPDFKRAAELLKAGGITLDAISASNMRHAVDGVGKIASAALSSQYRHTQEK